MIVDLWLANEQRSVRHECEQLIWAAPLFLLPRLAPALPTALRAATGQGSYAPWLVANLTLAEPPQDGAGAPLAWDNVIHGGRGLGYIVATHQQLAMRRSKTVLTWYHAWSDEAPAITRKKMLDAPPQTLAQLALDDLQRAHHDIRSRVERIDLTRHGHAMIRPTPGALWGAGRQRLLNGWQGVSFAHADVSGVSLLEEANYRGVTAAERALARL